MRALEMGQLPVLPYQTGDVISGGGVSSGGSYVRLPDGTQKVLSQILPGNTSSGGLSGPIIAGSGGASLSLGSIVSGQQAAGFRRPGTPWLMPKGKQAFALHKPNRAGSRVGSGGPSGCVTDNRALLRVTSLGGAVRRRCVTFENVLSRYQIGRTSDVQWMGRLSWENYSKPPMCAPKGDSKVFKTYSQMKLQMKREALEKLDRQANERREAFDTGSVQ